MGKYNKLAAVAAAVSTLAWTAPAQAVSTAADAEQLRKLDIMLMVSSLRCRFGTDNFQADYDQFSTNQHAEMQEAYRVLEADYAARMGTAGAKKALDRVSVGMANQYGQGHPWLGCADLKAMTRDLAGAAGSARLLAAADEALRESPPVYLAARH
jgi:hypothetical protein